ncbi:MAG: FKBP-type peptidyl-prolyl cis-trans isomerase [Spirochaetia bacterium]|nr:FKBP-type peptidyl-prolyl cis-trans isomerase [Spirochaetia bacterium]
MKNKRKSVLIIAAVSLLLTSTMLFAEGTREVAPEADVAKVVNITKTGEGEWNFDVVTENAETTIHVDPSTKSIMNPANYRIGDYITVNPDTDTIRYITPLVINGIVPFKEFPVQITVPPTDYGTDNLAQAFSYAYGELIGKSMNDNKLTLQGGYFARGIIDCVNQAEHTLYTMDQLTDFLKTFQNDIMANNKLPKDNGEKMDMDQVKQLESSDNIDNEYSYAYGYLLSAQMLSQGLDIEGDYLAQGILDHLFSNTPLITDVQQQLAMNDYQKQYTEERQQEAAKLAKENLAAAETFLKTNKTNADVTTTADGIEYKVLTAGDGPIPASTDTVTLNYELSDPKGNVISTSFGSKPVQFALNQVVPGFAEAVEQMHVGSTIITWIHPSLGYGENGTQGIEPNMMLTFKIQLISIDTAAAATTPASTDATANASAGTDAAASAK